MVAEQLVVAGGVGAAGDRDELERGDLGEAGGDRLGADGQGQLPGGAVAGVAAVAVAVEWRRQGDQPVSMHAVEGDPGGHVFAAAVGAVPAQGVADGVGDGPPGRQGDRELADAVELGGGEVPAAVAGRVLAAGGAGLGHDGWSFPVPGRVMFQGSRASSTCPAGGLPPFAAQACR